MKADESYLALDVGDEHCQVVPVACCEKLGGKACARAAKGSDEMPHGGRLAKPFAAFHAVGLKKLMKGTLHVAYIIYLAPHQYFQLPGISGLQRLTALVGV
jgi:hypothetical protein